mmetsp:Transcript_21759/g.22073  ORF Transcript_21759/g.22073 Transcript_21759/m.22073 type:complete len:99 (+) Transcript_21759:118-414(+)
MDMKCPSQLDIRYMRKMNLLFRIVLEKNKFVQKGAKKGWQVDWRLQDGKKIFSFRQKILVMPIVMKSFLNTYQIGITLPSLYIIAAIMTGCAPIIMNY